VASGKLLVACFLAASVMYHGTRAVACEKLLVTCLLAASVMYHGTRPWHLENFRLLIV
jgi:hypothetical protein